VANTFVSGVGLKVAVLYLWPLTGFDEETVVVFSIKVEMNWHRNLTT
jgi:hypothetical protein